MSGLITGPNFLSFFKDLDSFQLGTMVAVLEIGAFRMFSHNPPFVCLETDLWKCSLHSILVTSILAGRVGDIIGRRMTLFTGAVLFAIGGAVQTFTNGYGMMVAGRVVSGFGVGLLS